MDRVTRRQVLQLIGMGAVGVHCGAGADDDSVDSVDSDLSDAQSRTLLKNIDHFVILMMENRSFDHYMGALQRDPKYARRKVVNGTSGDEWNPTKSGKKITIHEAKTFELESPPHGYAASHRQYDDGKNDRFVIEHSGPHEGQAMAYYDRKLIPFYYWLADHFTVCDRWHASVMGPTGPNRLYLHCGTSRGKKVNTPFESDAPETIWDAIRKQNVQREKNGRKPIRAVNYYAGKSASITHMVPHKAKAGHIPVAKIDEFWKAAKHGNLPHVSYIDPHFRLNEDHPPRNISKGQLFVHSVYNALKKSPQWSKTMFVLMYDEHGGFWDHVAPPTAVDEFDGFHRYGFRVPAFVAGPLVRRGHVESTLYDHSSVVATICARFGIPHLSKRAAHANLLAHAIDPDRVANAAAPEAIAAEIPPPMVLTTEELAEYGETSQPEVEASENAGVVSDEYMDLRPIDEQNALLNQAARDLGALAE